MFKMKTKPRCGLCGGKLRDGSGIMQYRATDDTGLQHMFNMDICKECCDDMDEQHEKADHKEVRDWLLRK